MDVRSASPRSHPSSVRHHRELSGLPTTRRLGTASPWATRIRRLWQGVEFVALAFVLAYVATALDNQPDLLSRHLHRALTALGLPTGPEAIPVTTSRQALRSPTPPAAPTRPPATFPVPNLGLPATPAPALTSAGSRAVSPLVVWEYRVPTLGTDPARPQDASVQAAIAEFRERYPNVEVQVRWWNETDVLDGLQRALAGPATEVPDVVALPSPFMSTSQPLRLAAPVTARLHDEVLPTVWPAISLPANGKRTTAWMIPRWLEGRYWATSRPFWQKAGMDLVAVAQQGWTYEQVDAFLQKAVGSAGARSVRPPVIQISASPVSWASLLTAASVPMPYGWKEPFVDPTIPSPDQLLWSDTVLSEILSAWRGWWNRLYPDSNKQSEARDAWRSESFQWLPTIKDGRPLLAGPVRPAAWRPLLRPFFFREWAADVEPATADGSESLMALRSTGDGNGSSSGPAPSALAIVPVPGPRLPAPRLATVSGYVLPHRPLRGQGSEARAQLAQELALLLARRTARWAAEEMAFVPAWRQDWEWAQQHWATHEAAMGWSRMPETRAWVQAATALTPAPLLPAALGQARDQALQALASLTAPALAGQTPWEDVAAQVTRLLASPYR